MELLKKANWVDVLILILLLRIGYGSIKNGLSHDIFSLFGAGFNLVLAHTYYSAIGKIITNNVFFIPIALSEFLSFLVIAVAVGFALKLFRLVFDKLITIKFSPLLERIGGTLSGIIKGSITVSIVLMVISLMPMSYMKESVREKSLTGTYFVNFGLALCNKISPRLPPLVKTETP